MYESAQDLAGLLNGREYRNEITREEIALAKKIGLVVIFGYSDDGVSIRGAIDDDAGAFDGTTFNLDAKGIVKPWDEIDHRDEDECADYFARKGKGAKVIAKWDHSGYSWFIESTAQAATFDIMEDDERFCRGIVIDVRDLSEKPKPVAFEDGGASIRGGLKYTLAAAMEDAAQWVAGATFHAESRGWRPAVCLLREEILRQRLELDRAAIWHRHYGREIETLETACRRISALNAQNQPDASRAADGAVAIAGNAIALIEACRKPMEGA